MIRTQSFLASMSIFLLAIPTLLMAQHSPWKEILKIKADSAQYNFVDVSFSDARNGTALGWSLDDRNTFGGYTTVLKRTKDGGKTWISQKSPVWSGITIKEAKFRKIVAIDSLHLFAVGDSGLIIATSDAGEHWSQQDSMHKWSYWDVSFCDPLNGIACANYGIIAITSDGGSSWAYNNNVYQFALQSVCAISPKCFYVFDSFYGKMLRTFDRGKTWDTIQAISDYFIASSGKQIQESLFLDSQTGFAVGFSYEKGFNAFIIRTSNGGLSWDTVFDRAIFSNSYPQSIAFADKLHGVAAAGRGVLMTSDGGLTWTEDSITTVSNDNGRGVAYPSLGRMFVCSSEGFVGSLVGYLPSQGVVENSRAPQELEAHPNPSPSEIHVHLLASAALFDIALSDMLGRTVRHMLNVRGADITIQREGLPSGTYMLKVSSGGLILRSKVVLK